MMCDGCFGRPRNGGYRREGEISLENWMISLLTNRFLLCCSNAQSLKAMPFLMLKDLPRYECLLGAARLHPELDPSACEAYLNLLRAGDEAYSKSEAFLVDHGMTPGRFTIMMLLYDKQEGSPIPRTPAELADMANVTRATITGLIDTLERDGLVTREHDAGDRRMMQIHMTPKGHSSLRGLLPGYFRQMASQMASLNEHERKTLVRLLNKIAAHPPSAHIEAGLHASA
jgi:DNA-binding MarR family transcriptional regulator